MCVPALCYTFQNYMMYVALGNLDVTTSQVTYQLKLLTTALFTVLLLHRNIAVVQWLSLVVLMVGVVLVQLAYVKEPASTGGCNGTCMYLGSSVTLMWIMKEIHLMHEVSSVVFALLLIVHMHLLLSS